MMAQGKITFTPLSNMTIECSGMGYTNTGKLIFKSGGSTPVFKGFITSVSSYDPVDDYWSIIAQGTIPRRYHNIEYAASENKIYIFNGEFTPTKEYNPSAKLYSLRNSKILFTDAIEIYDLKLKTINITNSNPYPVMNAGSAVWNNKIYFFGGWNPMGYSDRFYEYDPAKDEWEKLPDMPESKQTTGKIVNGVLYTFGGYDGDKSNYKTIHSYDIKEGKWNLVGELPIGISANAIASDGRNIWLVGSYNNLNFLAAFDTKTKTVKTFESNLVGRRHAGAEVIGNILYVFGGNQTPDLNTALLATQGADISKYMNSDK
jgi:N-acetylneuraminic acid mutarotase